MDIRKRVLKNCWASVGDIKKASGMIDVVSAIREAKADLFKSRNRGIFISQATDKSEARHRFDRRELLTKLHEKKMAIILLEFIPHRLKGTLIYKDLIALHEVN